MSSNLIDFVTRRRQKMGEIPVTESISASDVLDMTERREAVLDEERREVKRTILTEFVNTFVVLPKIGLQKIRLYDVSKSGIAFDLDFETGQFQQGEEVAIRIYLNKSTYFPFLVRIENVREVSEDQCYRHGTRIVEGSVNDVALHHFIAFIETVSTSLKKDNGDIMVSKLNP